MNKRILLVATCFFLVLNSCQSRKQQIHSELDHLQKLLTAAVEAQTTSINVGTVMIHAHDTSGRKYLAAFDYYQTQIDSIRRAMDSLHSVLKTLDSKN